MVSSLLVILVNLLMEYLAMDIECVFVFMCQQYSVCVGGDVAAVV